MILRDCVCFLNFRPAKGTLGVSGYSLGGLMSAHALFTRRDDFNRANLGVRIQATLSLHEKVPAPARVLNDEIACGLQSSSFFWDDEVMIKVSSLTIGD